MPSVPLPSPSYSTGRHTPYYTHPDVRIFELNRRLQHRIEDADNVWWDTFATEFFEDDATLTLSFCLEDGPKRYSIGRNLIPRYFRSIFEGGVKELYYHVVQPKESYHNNTSTITLDCDNTTMVTHHNKPVFTKVCTEGRLILEFALDDLMRIRNWHFAVRHYTEMIPRNLIGGVQDPGILEQLSKNITRQGMTNTTLNYLRLCVILEPMQELMSRHKTYNMNPRDCLKSTLFQRWQRMCAPPEYNPAEMLWQPNTPSTPGSPFPKLLRESLTGQPVSTKETSRPRTRRKRKTSTNPNSSTPSSGINSTSSKKKSPSLTLATQDVMVVGEPSLMGGEFGDEDERLITRLGCEGDLGLADFPSERAEECKLKWLSYFSLKMFNEKGKESLLAGKIGHLLLENTQYDASNGVGDEGEFGGSPVTDSPSIPAWSSDRKPNPDNSTGD